MIKLVRLELRKAFSNKWFLASLTIACSLSIASAVGAIVAAAQYESIGLEYFDQKYFRLSVLSCYKHWIGVDSGQPATGLFYLLLPLLAAIPYSWSSSYEKKSGYVSQVVTRTNIRSYYLAKYLAVFASGASVIGLSLLVNLFICACSFPAYTPDVFDVVYFGLYEDCLWSEVFYTNPLLYTCLLTTITILFAGLWAVTISTFSFVVKNRLLFTVLPFLILIFVEYLNIAVLNEIAPTTLTPFEFLRGSGTPFSANGWVVFVWCITLFAVSAVGFLTSSKKDVI